MNAVEVAQHIALAADDPRLATLDDLERRFAAR